MANQIKSDPLDGVSSVPEEVSYLKLRCPKCQKSDIIYEKGAILGTCEKCQNITYLTTLETKWYRSQNMKVSATIALISLGIGFLLSNFVK